MDIQPRTRWTRSPAIALAIAATLSVAATILFSGPAYAAVPCPLQTDAEQTNTVSADTTVSADAYRPRRTVDPSAWRTPQLPGHDAGTIAHSSDPGLQQNNYRMISYTHAGNEGNDVRPRPVRPSAGPLPSPHDQPLPRGVPPTDSGPVHHASFDSTTPASYLDEAHELEQTGQWGEALAIYQKALKEYPDSRELLQNRSMARLHFDLDRRYSDQSFVRTIGETNGQKALNVYAEVLLRIQSYYVEEPEWSQLAGFGLSSLEVALQSEDFQQTNIPSVTPQQIENAIASTRQQLRNYSVGNRHDVYVIAGTAAGILEKEIGLPPQAAVYEFVCGAISALDPYSAFMSSNQYNETMSQIEGNFVGLGVELRTHADYLEIVNVIRGGSADRQGIQTGDRIIAVDNRMVTDAGSERAADMLRGTEGSRVELAIDRGGIPHEMTLERRRVEIPSVDQVSIIDEREGVGYIQLTNFQKTTARDFDAALWELQRKGMQSLIVDVRGNPGGLLKAAVEVADRFVKDGVIVSTRGRNPLEDYVHKARAAGTWRVPLVVLIDENSASASEIFAAAISDHDAGKIVGNRSYGKGSVQGLFPLNVSGGGVRLTTAKFYSPTGQAISEVGVTADYQVTGTARPDPNGDRVDSDDALRVATQVARQLIPGRVNTNAGVSTVLTGNR